MLFSFDKRYFDKPLSDGFVSLYTGKTIVMISMALLGLFMPIFLFELFRGDFVSVFVYYGIGFLVYGLTVAIGAQFLNRYGFRRALQTSVFLGALFYAIFYFINQENYLYLIPLTVIIIVLYRLVYWIPFHVDFAKFSDKKNRCRQVSVFEATRFAAGIFIPLIAGFIISRFGFDVLFIIVIFLYLISGIPYLSIPRTRENFAWTFKETWQEFFSEKRRKMIIAYGAYGAESIVAVTVWPIFIYQLLNGNYFKIGFIATLVIAVTVVLQLILGKYIDLKAPREKIIRWGSFFYALGWVIKIFIATAFQIFVVGAYHSICRVFLITPFDTLNYDIMADQGHYVDEFTVLREMAINFGKTLMMVAVILVSFYFAIQWVFLFAALSALVINLLRKEEPIMAETAA